ncbi:uncharacterized protein LOC114358028 [Ostrinia furnacalis]|uniref:uncharacterized protein LOC114358028 n=1 Tax=Ostrinia furnacalis TaxID=93504 RepID=UPI00103C8B47|nr:uncharacterized protein LOC114358028 [Ostrinia furnacalis]
MHSSDSQHPFFPYTEEEKQEIRKELGLKETGIQEDIDAILEWFRKQPHLVDAGINRAVIERTLITAKGSLDKTKQRLDALYKYRGLAPELIQNREKDLSDQHGELWSFYRQAAMPKLYKGQRVSILKIVDPDPNNFFIDILFRNTFMEGLGLRVSAIHVLNCPRYGQTVLNVMKQFFKPKILDRTIFHGSLDELYEYIPKRHLPKDYGGEEPSLDELKEKYEKECRSEKAKKFLIDSSKMVSNESKRSGTYIYDECLTGSFKKLDFD